MTPRQQNLAEQVRETDSGKLKHLIADLCSAFDSEREGNRQLRPGCREDCREHLHSRSTLTSS
jgi:hypothetical protein